MISSVDKKLVENMKMICGLNKNINFLKCIYFTLVFVKRLLVRACLD